ncbi:MAG: rhodanese-like domain-containing protein [Deltaproteobacteria bacterium]|nr:rhodanese-like domain-containing protein [Deltaproteobacteria bacterium]
MSHSTIDPSILQALLASDEPYACIDVRERGEFARAQIAGTSPVNRGTLELRLPVMVPDTRVPVVVLCDDGNRSALAAETLERMGYGDVRVLAGGVEAWQRQGLPVRSGWGVHGKEYGERVAHGGDVTHMNAPELARRRAAGDDLVVVDVRSREEYLRGHVPDTYHIPGGNLLVDAPRLPLRDGTTLVVSCAGRTRGILGAKLLHDNGFDNVYALENGVMGWFLSGHDIAEGPGREVPAPASATRVARIQRATDALASTAAVRRSTLETFRGVYDSDQAFYLLDVRLPEEFQAGHVPRAISLPLGQMALAHENFLAVRAAPVFLISDDDLRPVWAASLLQQLGFRDVSVLEGGLQRWRDAGLPLEQGVPELAVFGLDEAHARTRFTDAAGLQAHLDASGLALDVRSIGEYGFAHIPGTRWLPRGRLELDIEATAPDKDAALVMVCDNAIRSTLAAGTLRELGYARVQVLEGGTRAWESTGRNLEDGLEGTGVSTEDAQADFGHSVWTGALGKSREDMERYLSWEIDLVKDDPADSPS